MIERYDREKEDGLLFGCFVFFDLGMSAFWRRNERCIVDGCGGNQGMRGREKKKKAQRERRWSVIWLLEGYVCVRTNAIFFLFPHSLTQPSHPQILDFSLSTHTHTHSRTHSHPSLTLTHPHPNSHSVSPSPSRSVPR
jgi:hypothetical protein